VYFSNGKTTNCSAQKVPTDSLILVKTRVQSESLAENEITTGLLQSDINQDGNINSIDYSLIVKNYGRSNFANVDINRDGEVNSLDMAIVITNLGQNTVQ
jgi:Ca2+-binding EF-hand superfamily protein